MSIVYTDVQKYLYEPNQKITDTTVITEWITQATSDVTQRDSRITSTYLDKCVLKKSLFYAYMYFGADALANVMLKEYENEILNTINYYNSVTALGNIDTSETSPIVRRNEIDERMFKGL